MSVTTCLYEDNGFIWPEAIAFSPDTAYLALGSSDGSIRVFNTAKAQFSFIKLRAEPGNTYPITTLTWGRSPWSNEAADGIFAGFSDGHVMAVSQYRRGLALISRDSLL